ncbi:MAG: GatB/YqeY domain-containing protein [Gammaproteobacteria bacterium]|nr:GatB/YqeY domain-containing protein [Gammaproteobacteria bacterium]MCW8922057.1 GatB/YqeY domain-containing protein [Gammaproteobacteria bacterium]
MSSTLKSNLQDAMKAAMKAGEKERLGVIRLIMSALKQVEVDERIELDDTRIIGILDKMVKQRRESISQFDKAGRDDLSSVEKAEIDVIQAFLPQPLSEDEIEIIIKDAISKTGAESIKDMGKVMGIVRPQVVGRGDMGTISGTIKTILSA